MVNGKRKQWTKAKMLKEKKNKKKKNEEKRKKKENIYKNQKLR